MAKSTHFSDTFFKHENKVQIVYFSGTGGAARVALSFEKIFTEKGVEVVKIPLDVQAAGYQQTPAIENLVGLLVLIFPVHAFDAPAPVYEWIAGIPGRKRPALCSNISLGRWRKVAKYRLQGWLYRVSGK